jgi:hypothetical protein
MTMPPGQLSLSFESSTTAATSTSVRGLTVLLPGACSCGSRNAVVGSSSGPHYARIVCARCSKWRGWMSATSFNFVAEIIDQFGRPVAPIAVRNSHEGF